MRSISGRPVRSRPSRCSRSKTWIGQPLGLAARERILQGGEAGDAIGAHHGDLAVQIGGADLGDRQGGGDRPEARGPVEAAAGEHANLAGLEARRGAVAVQLDLVDPAIAGRRLVREGGELGRDEFRERGAGHGAQWARAPYCSASAGSVASGSNSNQAGR